MTNAPVRHADTIIFPASLDPKAVHVVERLTEAGFETYLVGGCVRDLLLGFIPKDFDVSTEARPRQIRRVFRNCRVIGRRFKLAHVHFGPKIIEVATFRRTPEQTTAESDASNAAGDSPGDDLLIVRDNVYGTSEEDAIRRDFTINALLYDVGKAEVIDWVGGVEDLETRTLRTIGEASVRIAEDPVRMLRAIKFTARLGLSIDPELDAAMHSCAGTIERSAPPRVLEEIHKLLTCGRAEISLGLLLKYGLLARLLPEVGPYWETHSKQLAALGRAIDHLDRGQRQLANATLLAVLWHDPWRDLMAAEPESDPHALARDLIAPAALRMSIPRRDVGHMKTLLTNQLRLERFRHSRRVRLSEFLARPPVQDAIDFLYLRCLGETGDPELHAHWAEKLARQFGRSRPGRESGGNTPRPSRRRRRRRRPRGAGRNERKRGVADGQQSGTTGPAREAGQAPSDPGSGDRDEERRPRRRRSRRGTPSEGPARGSTAPPSTPPGVHDPAQSGPASGGGSVPDPAEAPSASGGTHPAAHAAAPEAGNHADTPAPKGFKGLVNRFMRKVLAREEDPARASDTHPAPAPEATRNPERLTTRSTSTDSARAPDDSSSSRAPAAVPEQSTGPPGPQTDRGGAGQAQTDRLRPRRRRRGGRGRRKTAPQSAAQADAGSSDAARSPSASEAPAPDNGQKGEAGGQSKRGRRRRGGSRSKRGKQEGNAPSQQSGSRSRGAKPGGKSGRKSSGRSGDRKRDGESSRPDRSRKPRKKRSDQADDAFRPDTKPVDRSAPQHHPEDVEDIFDW